MFRKPSVPYTPSCTPRIPLIDQYMWDQKDSQDRYCFNGVSFPIYDNSGNINWSLPLEKYPQEGRVHREIAMTRRPRMNYQKQYYYSDGNKCNCN